MLRCQKPCPASKLSAAALAASLLSLSAATRHSWQHTVGAGLAPPNLKSSAARGNRLGPTCQLQYAAHPALTRQAGYVAASLPYSLQDVVWERLDDTTGNTQFLRADFCPYGSQSLQEQVAAAAQLAQEAFSSVVPPQRPQGKLAVLAACT